MSGKGSFSRYIFPIAVAVLVGLSAFVVTKDWTQLPKNAMVMIAPDSSMTMTVAPIQDPVDLNFSYVPATVEKYVLEHAVALGYDQPSPATGTGCDIWKSMSATNSEIYQSLQTYRSDLIKYNQMVDQFTLPASISGGDIRNHLDQCHLLDFDLPHLFTSQQLSQTRSGYVEPLLPPLRHPEICFGPVRDRLMDLSYLVHDMGKICRSLRSTSRTILIDMGASLDFHANQASPALYLIEFYRKFGILFDHIYAFEIVQKDPNQVFERVPGHLFSSYHWINVGVNSDPQAKLNPLWQILVNSTLGPDDFVVIKLDIDTSSIEVPLAHQILNDDRINRIVDHLYFEHHVFLTELSPYWGRTMHGSVKDSLQLFAGLREKGVASHSWV